MEAIKDILQRVATPKFEADDYRDDKGFLICGKCGTPKEREVTVPTSFRPGGVWRVGVPCRCQEAAQAEAERIEKGVEFERRMQTLQKKGITDPQYLRFQFANDDGANQKFSRVCRNYVDKWNEMRADNTGILLCGPVGTGKTFLACCVANALIAKLIPAGVTNFPILLDKLQGLSDSKEETLRQLQKYELLVIDDLGVERGTTYAAETIYKVIDTRARSGKPVIITTNLTIDEMENTKDLQYKRIYDRVLGMCPIRLNVGGASRRATQAEEKRKKALAVLWEGNPNG